MRIFLGILLFSSLLIAQNGQINSYFDIPSTVYQENSNFTASIYIDMSNMQSPDNLLGSFTGRVNYDDTILEFVSHSGIQSSFSGLVNTSTSGVISFNGTNISGASGNLLILNIDFKVIGSEGVQSELGLTYSAMAATSFNSLINSLVTQNFQFSILNKPLCPDYLTPTNSQLNVQKTDKIQWSNVTNAEGYKIWFGKLQNPTDIENGTDLGNVTEYSFSNLDYNTEYFWKVISYNQAGESIGCDIWKFTTEAAPIPLPGVPQLVAPSDNATEQSLTPTLDWDISSDAVTYEIQVSLSDQFTNTVVNQTGLTATDYSISASILSYVTQYHWRVRAVNTTGNSGWSTVRKFTTEAEPIPLPGIPELIAPEDNSTNISLTPTLDWNSSSDAVTYEIQVSLSDQFTNTVVNQTGLTTTDYSISVSILSYATQYHWRVRAVNTTGNSGWSTVWKFTTEAAPLPLPGVPQLVAPSDNATEQSLTPTLDWNSSSDAVTYEIQVSLSDQFTNTVVNQTGLTATDYSISASILSYATQYHWRVRAVNTTGNSAWSTIWNFTIENEPISIPGIPQLVAPINNAQNVSITPTLDWNSSSGAVTYEFQVSDSDQFVSTVVNYIGFSATEYSVSTSALNYSTKYYWRVRAVNTIGNSEWSTVRNFTTEAKPIFLIGIPQLNSPPNNSINISLTTLLDWIGSSNAQTYELQVSKNNIFSNAFPFQVNQNGLIFTQYNILNSVLNYSTKYYWRVRAAANQSDYSEWSSVWNFSTEDPTSVEDETIPLAFSIEQNYPNPFNPTTVIEYSVPSNEYVSLKIYDILGSEVATLVNEQKSAGNYTVNFDASKLSSGIYFYTIKAGSFNQVRKMLLVK